MGDRGILILGAHEVASALDGRETKSIEAVSRAYVSHRSAATATNSKPA